MHCLDGTTSTPTNQIRTVRHRSGGLLTRGIRALLKYYSNEAAPPNKPNEGGQTLLSSAVENVYAGVVTRLQPPTSAAHRTAETRRGTVLLTALEYHMILSHVEFSPGRNSSNTFLSPPLPPPS